MKSLNLMLLTAGCCAALPASGSIELALGQWRGVITGETGEPDNATTLQDLGFEENNSTVLWANFEHSVAAIPNLRLMHTRIATEGDSIVTESFSLGTIAFRADVRTQSKLDLTHTDITLYYELIDRWLKLDLGVTTRLFNGFVEAQSEFTPKTVSTLEGALPMLYLNGYLDMPFEGWSVSASANVIRYRGDGFHDYWGRLGYLHPAEGSQWGLNLGYRDLWLDVADFDDLYVDATISGAYLELVFKF